MTQPICIDLFCGYGGWARGFLDAGYRVIGFDNEPKCAKRYPGEFVLMDVRTLDGKRFRDTTVIVASPPCQGFSLANAQVRLHKRPTEEDWSTVRAAWRIAEESGVPVIIENVRGALSFFGPAKASWGSRYLWGDVPPFFLTQVNPPEKFGGSRWWPGENRPRAKYKKPEETSIVPYPLARALAEACLP